MKASIVDLSSPLGNTKRIDTKGISDTKNEITAYTIVQAESHEAAAELFANHPHFTIFPGQSVEVMGCLSDTENVDSELQSSLRESPSGVCHA
jgi:hypothetical protein